MEETELRVGGWEKERKRGIFRRLFYLCLIIVVSFLIGGSQLVQYTTAEIDSGSAFALYTGQWNGPYDEIQTKEFNGHLKISSKTYESVDGESGTLTIVSIRSFLDLGKISDVTNQPTMTNLVVQKLTYNAEKEGLDMGRVYISNENNNELPQNTVQLYSTAMINKNGASDGFFINHDEEDKIEAKVFYWTKPVTTAEFVNFQTIVCILFATNEEGINQGMSLIENVK